MSTEVPLPVRPIEPIPERAQLLEVEPAESTEVLVSADVESIFERAEPLEVQTAASTEVPLQVSAEVEPILEHVERLEVQSPAGAEVPPPVGAKVQPILERAKPLKVQPAVSKEVPLRVGAEVQPTLERAEPLYSNSSQLLHGNIVRQNILDALIVDQLTDAVTHCLSEVQPALSTEVPLPVSGEVQPTLEHAEPLEVQPAVSAEVPQPVGAEVQPILERPEPLEIQQAVGTEVPLPVGPKVQPILARAEPPKVQPAARPGLPLPVSGKVQSILERAEPLEVQPATRRRIASAGWKQGVGGLQIRVSAGRRARYNYKYSRRSLLWQSPTYLCTFADNRKVRARPKDIEVHNHGHSLQELEHPNLGSILSRRMTLRAQQLLSRQRPTHLPLAGKTKVPNEIAEINTGA